MTWNTSSLEIFHSVYEYLRDRVQFGIETLFREKEEQRSTPLQMSERGSTTWFREKSGLTTSFRAIGPTYLKRRLHDDFRPVQIDPR